MLFTYSILYIYDLCIYSTYKYKYCTHRYVQVEYKR